MVARHRETRSAGMAGITSTLSHDLRRVREPCRENSEVVVNTPERILARRAQLMTSGARSEITLTRSRSGRRRLAQKKTRIARVESMAGQGPNLSVIYSNGMGHPRKRMIAVSSPSTPAAISTEPPSSGSNGTNAAHYSASDRPRHGCRYRAGLLLERRCRRLGRSDRNR